MSSVFKYCAPKKHYFEVLSKNQVNFSHPRFLNDEAESAEYLIKPYQRFCKDVGWGGISTQIFDDQAIASFTNANYADNPCLWKEYARDSSGFAVEYDRNILSNLAESYCIPLHIDNVQYIDSLFDLNNYNNGFNDPIAGMTIIIKDCVNDFKQGDSRKLDYLFRHLRYVKLKTTWEQECESRMVIGQIAKNSKYLQKTPFGYNLDLPVGTIKSVTIGSRMCLCCVKSIIQIAEKNGYEIRLQDAIPSKR